MKKLRFLILFLTIPIVFLLAGCVNGGSLDSRLYLNGESGKLVMVYSDDYGEQERYLNMDPKTITELVRNNCPPELELSITDNGQKIQYTFRMRFSSMDEYIQKCTAILEQEGVAYDDPLIEYNFAGSPFIYKVFYEEHFDREDLLRWFIDLVKENKIISSEYYDKIIDDTKCTLYLDDRIIAESNSRIAVEDSYSDGIVALRYYTYVTDGEHIKRRITIDVDDQFFETKKDQIQNYFSDKLADLAEIEYVNNDNTLTINIECKETNIAGINSFMNSFEENDEEITFTYQGNETDGYDYLHDSYNIKENIDLSEYIRDDEMRKFYYVVDGFRNYQGTYDSDDGQEELYFINSEAGKVINNGLSGELFLDLNAISDPQISQIEMAVDVLGENRLKRSTTITYKEEYPDNYLEGKFSKVFGDNATVSGNGNKITIISEESKDNNIWNTCFINENYFEVNKKKQFLGLFKEIEVLDEFNCSVLTDHEIDIFTYTVNNVIGKDVTLQDGGEIKEGEYYLTINDLSPEKIKVSFASEGLDFVFLIKSVCLLILILILIDMTITGITIKNRKKAHVNYKLFDTEKDNYIYEENEEKIQLIEKMMSDRTV